MVDQLKDSLRNLIPMVVAVICPFPLAYSKPSSVSCWFNTPQKCPLSFSDADLLPHVFFVDLLLFKCFVFTGYPVALTFRLTPAL